MSQCLENGREPKHPAYPELADLPRSVGRLPALYSGSFGMGSRDLQPEGLIGRDREHAAGRQAQEAVLPVDRLPARQGRSRPSRRLYQQTIEEAYPNVRALALHGSENPNLMPKGSITVRFHSVGGWGAITTGKNLAMTLFDLLGYHIKANPKYGSEKKGQPTTYYLSAAPEPIRINCEYFFVDVVLSPDPERLPPHQRARRPQGRAACSSCRANSRRRRRSGRTIPAAVPEDHRGQEDQASSLSTPSRSRAKRRATGAAAAHAGHRLPGRLLRRLAADGAGRTRRRDAARGDPRPAAAQVRRQGRARGRGQHARRAARFRRGVRPVPHGAISDPVAGGRIAGGEPTIPVMVKRVAAELGADHRHPPLLGADRQLLRPRHGQRQHHRSVHRPRRHAGVDGAVPRHDVDPLRAPGVDRGELHCLRQVLHGLPRHGHPRPGQRSRRGARHRRPARCASTARSCRHLPQAPCAWWRRICVCCSTPRRRPIRSASCSKRRSTGPSPRATLEGDERELLGKEMEIFRAGARRLQVRALAGPTSRYPEKQQAGCGGLLSITVNPYTCKGCMECVEVCDDDALRPVRQTDASVEEAARALGLLARPAERRRRSTAASTTSRRGSARSRRCCSTSRTTSPSPAATARVWAAREKTIVHLFTATVEALDAAARGEARRRARRAHRATSRSTSS